MDEKGTCAPAREFIVFRLWISASIAWKVARSVSAVAFLCANDCARSICSAVTPSAESSARSASR